MNIKVVGLGGIGGCLIRPLALFLDNYGWDGEVVLIDGDQFKEKNRNRQEFSHLGNKAEVKAETLSLQFQKVYFRAEPVYVVSDNVVSLIREKDIIFLCVDNDDTRKLVSDRCEELDEVLLISGGNDLIRGGLQVFWRKGGQNQTLPLTNDYHPHIQHPKDKNPGEVGCEERAESEPQVFFMNNLVAAKMLGVFYGCLTEDKVDFDEIYCGLTNGVCRPVNRREKGVNIITID